MMRALWWASGSDYRDTMKHMSLTRAVVVIVLLSSLSACGLVDRIGGGASQTSDPVAATDLAAPDQTVEPTAIVPLSGAQQVADLDQTTDAERAAATAAATAGGGQSLGSVIVALGSPAEQGFWLQSSLVTEPGKGRVVTDTGQSVAVDLRPASGAALLSLAAYRALGLGLTDLPEVQVFAN